MPDLHLLTIGTSAVIDSVLLFSLLERPNRRHIPLWMIILVGAAWLWHASSFLHWLLIETTRPLGMTFDLVAMLGMAASLLVLPGATVHGTLRLFTTGVEPRPPIRWRLALAYLPLLALVWVARDLAQSDANFVLALERWQLPYLTWLTLANGIGAFGFYKLRDRFELPRANTVFVLVAVNLLLITVLVDCVIFTRVYQRPDYGPLLLLLLTLSPVGPVIVFAYFVMRFRFIPLVMERTLVYGAVFAGLLLMHRLVFQEITDRLSDRLQFDVGILEGILGIMLILAWRPLRRRVSEALRYLLGRSVSDLRKQTRLLSVELSTRANQNADTLTNWFATRITQVFRVEHVELIIQDKRTNETPAAIRLPDSKLTTEISELLIHEFQQDETQYVTPRQTRRKAVLDALDELNASAAIRSEHDVLHGLMFIGRRPWNQYLTEEDINSLILIFEQLLVTLHNRRLQTDRLEAERRAMQHEKLSVLGLLAGSIAHEIKNPLSSIKTIAAVLAEDLSGSAHAEDLDLIRGEIRRLSLTTSQLLDFARPNSAAVGAACPAQVVEQILQVVRHLAQKSAVKLDVDSSAAAKNSFVAASESTLREIYLNLIVNAIDAAGANGRVTISCQRKNDVNTVAICDSGSGISAEMQNHLFEPFHTDKIDGTGLGLYIVSKRVEELQGRISCHTSPETGTSFEVELPEIPPTTSRSPHENADD